jgi:hypothetical protein
MKDSRKSCALCAIKKVFNENFSAERIKDELFRTQESVVKGITNNNKKDIYFSSMNSREIFSIALGLSTPWYVKKVEFLGSADSLSKELHLYLDFERGHRFTLSLQP